MNPSSNLKEDIVGGFLHFGKVDDQTNYFKCSKMLLLILFAMLIHVQGRVWVGVLPKDQCTRAR